VENWQPDRLQLILRLRVETRWPGVEPDHLRRVEPSWSRRRDCGIWLRLSSSHPRVRVELRRRQCGSCREMFVICRSCDRGHRYCSRECSGRARAASLRRARRRHRHSPEGRADHRDAERRRRLRRRVGDQGSVHRGAPAMSEARHAAPPSSDPTPSIRRPSLDIHLGPRKQTLTPVSARSFRRLASRARAGPRAAGACCC
jgi:hypothetical protein